MKDKKGFTLIELLAVLIIIGLILLTAIPSVIKLMVSNDTKEYNNYVIAIREAANRYSLESRDELGGNGDTGCVEVTLADLIKLEYIKKFNDNDITCTGTSRIYNKKGKLEITSNVSCVDKDNKETFKLQQINLAKSCKKYAPNNTTSSSTTDQLVTIPSPTTLVTANSD